ncbi:hypothetical protein [Bacteroides sp.]|uniref:hypothetical protein n=1 Tax=Bacteroides sp. TaxID=29523 RepID=UPI00261B7EAA|nr:hypothetical protein [Bacteroides sp.]
MTDIAMKDFTPASNMEYIYAEASDGSQVKISKKDLVAILAGPFPLQTFYVNVTSDRLYVLYIKTTETGAAIGEIIAYNSDGNLEMKPFNGIISEGHFTVSFEKGLPKNSKILLIYYIYR